MNIIGIHNLIKNYGEVKAVRDISFDINEGEMFGFVGPDGAGKTTTLRIMCGLINPDSGIVSLFEKDITKERKNIQSQIGYLSQKFSLYGDLSVDENIEFFADIHNVRDYKKRRDELLDFTKLKPFRDRLADKLSGGMKQKLALACSLIHQPKILFLDEPTTGVDPVSRRDFWKILSNLLKEGITIFMTTPYLDEAERCNRIALMNNGKIIALDTPAKVKESTGIKVIELVVSPLQKAIKILNENSWQVQSFGDRLQIITQSPENDLNKILDLLKQNNLELIDNRIISPSLENVFIHLIKK
ncbi:MAG: ABC transporter ATP-binding protein [Melioribacteraceae bacterium]|nr:ABC transporter ATP-binding protein [Melioribacteraceae bacterium]